MREWISDYCKNKAGTIASYKPEWDQALFRVGGKIYASLGSYRDGRAILNVKLEPAFSECLRAEYEGGVIPGYYSNKTHWSSVFLESGVPDEKIMAMLDQAYGLVYAALPKRVRIEICEANEHA